MRLSELVIDHSPDHEAPAGSGLNSLVRPEAATVAQPATRMTLPAYMNALKRGEIARPADGDLAGMVVDMELPPKPVDRPVDKWKTELEKIKAEIAVESAIDHAELRHRIAAKKGISIEAAQEWMERNAG
jgi:hypothetical protein